MEKAMALDAIAFHLLRKLVPVDLAKSVAFEKAGIAAERVYAGDTPAARVFHAGI